MERTEGGEEKALGPPITALTRTCRQIAIIITDEKERTAREVITQEVYCILGLHKVLGNELIAEVDLGVESST